MPRGFASWSDLPALRDAGLTLGSHTLSHPNLKRMAGAGAEREIRDSRVRIEQEIGCSVDHFSYPYGRRTRAIERLVRAAGYRTAVVTGQRCNARFASLHRLFRLRVDGRDGAEGVQRALAGIFRGEGTGRGLG